MNIRQSQSAFSLIELSIVVLIIGLLVASVAGGKKLVSLSNLSKARALTNSSPVSGIEDLSLWLETTSKNSFSVAAPTDGATISTWYDINPQQTTKGTAAAGASLPAYNISSNSINGLPVLNFDGADNMAGPLVLTGTSATIFVVAKRNAIVTNQTAFTLYGASANDSDNSASAVIAFEGTGTSLQSFRNSVGLANFTHPGNNVPYIFTTKFDGTTNNAYLNGVIATTPVTTTGSFNTTNYLVGARYFGSTATTFYNGYIGEIIVYNRALSDFERGQIETYLSKKWSIKLP